MFTILRKILFSLVCPFNTALVSRVCVCVCLRSIRVWQPSVGQRSVPDPLLRVLEAPGCFYFSLLLLCVTVWSAAAHTPALSILPLLSCLFYFFVISSSLCSSVVLLCVCTCPCDLWPHVHIFLCVCVCVRVYLCSFLNVCLYMCICVCVCVCVQPPQLITVPLQTDAAPG